MAEKNILSEVVTGLCNIFGDTLLEIILYGSVAKNEATTESDIDIAIVISHSLSAEDRERFLELASMLDLKYEKVLSIIDIEQEQLEKWGNVLPFYKTIQEEGIILWKAA